MTQPVAVPPGERSSLARRTGWVMVAVVVIAVIVAALVSVGLIRSAARSEATKALSAQADVVVGLLDAGRPANLPKALRVVRAQQTPVAWQLADGGPVRGEALARAAYAKVSATGSQVVQVDGRDVLVEARDLATGGRIVLAKNASDAIGPSLGILRRELIALGIGLVVAIGAALVFARRLAAPLRQTADAAGRLAAGERAVRLTETGPREVAEVAAAVNELAVALQHSETRQRDFLMSVSHELRTPLTAIRGFGESLADEVTDDPAAAGRTIVAESTRLERLVTDLLDLSRLGADNFRFEFARVDLRAEVAAAAVVWRERCDRVGVQFVAEQPEWPVEAETDPARLRQIIDGLAENALRVTPSGRPLVLALGTDGREAWVQVRDGGPGLTDDDIAVAFERSVLYERYRGVRRVGTGLGLALVAALAGGLGGRAVAGHAPEGGSAFSVVLPLGESAGEHAPTGVD